VPNTLNVITNFPFLIVGVLGFVLCLGGGSFFNIRLPGELWGWLLFYGGTASVAFGSAYYHLRPDDNRVLLDTLPKESEIADEFPFYFIHNHSPFGILLPYFCQMLHNIKLIHICADDDCLFLTFLYFYTRETRRKNWIKLPFFTSSSCCSKHKLCKVSRVVDTKIGYGMF
ncbi:hypothetical protein ES319_D06G099200v1, partial [Gossypium barbadense]